MRLLISLRLELGKILRQRGTYAGPAVLLAVTGLASWAMWKHGAPGDLSRRLGSDMVVGGKLLTGLMVARFIMEPCLIVLLPLMVAAVAGGLVAGEARSGLLRTWMCRPVSRLAVLTGKQLAAWAHALLLTLFLGLAGAGLGYAFFGGGDLIDFTSGDGLVILSEPLGWQRLALAYAIAGLLMCAMASLALLASTIFENPLVASAVAVAFLPLATLLGTLPYFEAIQPYLLTSHLDVWHHAFRGALDLQEFAQPLSCVLGYCLVPYVLAAIIFQRKDITC
jgi:ABC-2 type transport system permease protein